MVITLSRKCRHIPCHSTGESFGCAMQCLHKKGANGSPPPGWGCNRVAGTFTHPEKREDWQWTLPELQVKRMNSQTRRVGALTRVDIPLQRHSKEVSSQ